MLSSRAFLARRQLQQLGARLYTQTLPHSQPQQRARPLVRRGRISPTRTVPDHIVRPPYAGTGIVPPMGPEWYVHDAAGVRAMRRACGLTARVLDYAASLVGVGITTDELDRAIHSKIIELGAYPSCLNYDRYPKSCCTSVNEVVCHGIPDDRALQDGDIVNIDLGVYIDGHHGDSSRMYLVGQVDSEGVRLAETTRQALQAGIGVCGPGVPISEIGRVIAEVCEREGFSSVRKFSGHGVGRQFHTMPLIVHCRNDAPGRMLPGMTFTIEPMLCEGRPEVRARVRRPFEPRATRSSHAPPDCSCTGACVRGQLDSGDCGPQAVGAGGAHAAHHGPRRGGADGGQGVIEQAALLRSA